MNVNVKTCDLITALTSDKYASYQYKVDSGSLYLTDGSTKNVKVDLMDDETNYTPYTPLKFLFLQSLSESSRPSSLADNIKNRIQQQFVNISIFKGTSYSNACGIPEITIKNENLIDFLKRCTNLDEVNDLCNGSLSTRERRNLVAQAFQDQEKEILANIPEELFSDPNALHSAFLDLLHEKGLDYEQAVSQFDWSNGKPSAKAVEGSYVLAKLIAQVEAWKAIRSKSGREAFPFEDVWRFCIDGSKEKFGAYIFENEPFYILSSLRGLKKIVESEEQPNQGVYESFAAALMKNPPILKDNGALAQSNALIKMNSGNIFFGCKMTGGLQKFNANVWKHDSIGEMDITKRSQDQQEADKRIKLPKAQVPDEDYFIANATGFEKMGHFIGAYTATTSNIIAQRIFLGLDNLIQKSNTPGERLIAYIWAARELEITHQLEDGNGRTSIGFLINQIANDPELPFYIPEDPNILDQQAPEALLRDIHQGMLRFVELSKGDPESIITVDTLLDQASVKGQSWDIVHQRAKLPDEVIKKLVEEDKKYVAEREALFQEELKKLSQKK